MSRKAIVRWSLSAMLLIIMGQVFAACGENASSDANGVCQCKEGFFMDGKSRECHPLKSSEANVLP